jgi:predicted lipase
MGFFSSDAPKRVTKEEWKEIRSNLYGKLDEREREELEKFFRADLDESGIEQGISRAEFDAGMTWLKANMKKHIFEEIDLDSIAQYFEENLKD